MSSATHPHRHEPDDERGGTAREADDVVFVLDRESVRAVDRAAIDEFGVPGIVLMENAARGLTDAALDLLGRCTDPDPTPLIVCGGGNNGGDGYALARHLHNAGFEPLLAPLSEPRAGTDAAVNSAICDRIGIRRVAVDEESPFRQSALIVDAVLGTGLDRTVTGPAADVIDAINRSARPVLAVDVPSGLDCDTGRPLGAAVRADMTVTFVGIKPGFLELDAQPFLGEVVVADIGAPIELLRRYGRRMRSGPPDPHPPAEGETTAPPR